MTRASMSIFLGLASKFKNVNAIFEAFLVGKDDQTFSMTDGRTKVCLFQKKAWGWRQFVLHTDMVEKYTIDGHITFMCGVIVVNDRSIPAPPSNIGKHLATLLDSTDGTDVSFIIDNETFHVHRAVLAAHSPVFKAELLGSMG
jgi:speckle-type POZ protein